MGLVEGIKKAFSANDGLRLRQEPVPTKNNEIGVSEPEDDLVNKAIQSEGSIIDASDVDKFVTLSKYRDERYAAFEGMLTDPITAAALEMYADDATQYNRDGDIVWVEADEPVIADAANRLIRVLGINANAWRHIYSLCTYGDLYFRLYKKGDEPDNFDTKQTQTSELTAILDDKQRKLEERIEYVNNPGTIFDLQEKDKTTGFVRVKSYVDPNSNYISHNYLNGNYSSSAITTVQSRDCQLYHNQAFVHIMLSESITRTPEYLAIDRDDDTGTQDVYKIKTGKSALEDAYPASQTLSLLEDSLVMNRLSKSAIVRLLQIEIGDAPKSEGEHIVHRVKNLMEQKMSLNKTNETARSYNNPGPIENTVYVPTRNGKGAIETSTIGGDVDIKSIADVDYFQNLKLAALKIPKQYLNFDSAEGFSNGTSLTKQSSRYAHTIMRVQYSYIQGITTILNIFFMDKGLDYVNKFTVKMVRPTTIEDAERDDSLNDKINQTRDILDLLDTAGASEETKGQVLVKMINEFVEMPEVSEMLNKDLKNQPETPEDETTDVADEDKDFSGDEDFIDDFDSMFSGGHGMDIEPPTVDDFDLGEEGTTSEEGTEA